MMTLFRYGLSSSVWKNQFGSDRLRSLMISLRKRAPPLASPQRQAAEQEHKDPAAQQQAECRRSANKYLLMVLQQMTRLVCSTCQSQSRRPSSWRSLSGRSPR